MRIYKKHGVLLAGVNGHKIYCKDSRFIVVARYTALEIPKDKEAIVQKYVNLKYYNISEQEKIRSDFLDLISGMI